MAEQMPQVLVDLLNATDPESREVAWQRFVRAYRPVLLRVAQSARRGTDDATDRYTSVLEQLGRNDYERLRQYASRTQSDFTTWLAVVARRLCTAAQPAGLARAAPSGNGPDTALQGAGPGRAREASLANLAPADRLLLTLRFNDQLPAHTIAAILGIPAPVYVYRYLWAVLRSLPKRARGMQPQAGS